MLIAPAKLIYAVFLKTLGYLLLFLGAKEWGNKCITNGTIITCGSASLFIGLWSYGRRFLVHSENSEQCCRGSCYWVIDRHFRNPEISLTEIVKEFEGGAPDLAIQWHKNHLVPIHERKIWSETTFRGWPPMPKLDPGVYTFLIGYSKNGHDHGKAHRVVFFRGEQDLIFDPNTGLSEWVQEDWDLLLDRIASEIRSSKAGYFTLECYLHRNVLH